MSIAKNQHKSLRKKVLQMVEVGYIEDTLSRSYDILNALAIVINIIAAVLHTFPGIRESYGTILQALESGTVLFFAVDYILRLWTAPLLYPDKASGKAVLKYIFSFSGIVDLLSFLPYYLPFFFPEGAVAFRMFRIVRIFRLFRINAYYDSLNVITAVIVGKKQQLLSSVFIILVLMVSSSLCMYSIENPVQPDVFRNAFSGIWWAASTLLTVGYGDIYPITTAGRVMGILITFLGCGMVAIPTGIISAGFVEQYQHLRSISEQANEEVLRFLKIRLGESDPWAGSSVQELQLPVSMRIAAIQRAHQTLLPEKDTLLQKGDVLILTAERFQEAYDVHLKKILLKAHHPWNGQYIRDLDISRQTFLVGIQRGGKLLTAADDFMLQKDDELLLYTRKHIAEADTVDL